MLRRSLSLVSLGLLAATGCSLDMHASDAERAPLGTATEAEITPAAGPGLDSASGFPYRLVDRFVPFADFATMLRDAATTLPGVLGTAEATNDTNDFLARVQATTPPFRLNAPTKGGARLVQVYSDAPVYVINGFALLPDSAGNPVDPNAFKLDGSADPAFDAFCTQQASRCIPLSREHLENRLTAAILLAARTIIVRGKNHTDGMSLVVMSENLLMPSADDLLDLSPRGAQYIYGDGTPAARVSPASPVYTDEAGSPSPYGGRKIVAYRAMPGSPQVPDVVESATTQDLQWQQQQGALEAGVPLDRATQGLAGLAGGNLLGLTMRASPLNLRSVGQHGGYGAAGKDGKYSCTFGEVHPGAVPFFKGDSNDCDGGRSDWGGTQRDCPQICGSATPATAGGAGGAGGDAGSVHVLSATAPFTSPGMTGWCAFTESALRNPSPAKPMDQGDAPEGYNLRCADGIADDRDGANVDCASSFCSTDLNVLTCGTREGLVTLPIGRVPFTLTRPASFAPPMHVESLNAIPIRRPFPVPTLPVIPPPRAPKAPLDGDSCDGSGDTYQVTRTDQIQVLSNNGGTGGHGGSVGGAWCNAPIDAHTLPVMCMSSAVAPDGVNGRDGAATPNDYLNHARVKWTRLAWAIALHRLMPLEVQRRLTIAHERFRAGDLLSAKARYLSTGFVVDANLRRRAGTHTDGTVFDCSTTVWHPATSSAPPAPGTPAPVGLEELCAMRVELDTYLGRLVSGQNYFGYAPDYQVPRVVPTTQIIDWAKGEIANAKSELSTWQLAAALNDVGASLTARSDDFLANQIATLHAEYSPGGSLATALDNARKEKAASIAALSTLDKMAQADSVYTFILNNDDGTEATFKTDALELSIINVGIRAAMTAAGAGPVASVTADAVTGAIGKDALGPDGSTDVRLDTLAGEITNGLPNGAGAALDAESQPSGSRDLQRLKLDSELFQIILRERDEVRNLGRAAEEEQLVIAQIAEAQAQEQRLLAYQSSYARHDSAALDALLDADYASARRTVQRAAEYTFLAVRAAERDGVPFKVAADGTTSNQLIAPLDSVLASCGLPGNMTVGHIDVRLDPAGLDCWSSMLTALESTVLYGYTGAYSSHGSVTKVVPITPSMRFVDPATGSTRYAVSVDVSLDDVHALPLLQTAAAHKLADMAVLLDTGVSGSDAIYPVSFSRTDKDAYWLGATTKGGGTGADASEFFVQGGMAGGPLGPNQPAPLQVLFLTQGWSAAPTLTFPMCRGSASANDALVNSTSGAPAACRLTNYPAPVSGSLTPTAAAAYVGRALLGRYDFVVPAEALVGTTNALRVQFQFDARQPL